jgi:AbrB family looped-hinge helix DNA binding protein
VLWEELNLWAHIRIAGMVMVETTAKLDEKGRVRIPKQIREAAQLKEGSCVSIKAEGKAVVIEPAEPVADKYYGAFKVENWPEDLDDFVGEAVRKRWKQRCGT